MSITCSCIISLQRHVKTSYWQITVWQPFPFAVTWMLSDSRSDCFYCSLSFVITGFSLRGIKQVRWHWRPCVFVWICKKKKNSWCDFLSCMRNMSTNPPRSGLPCALSRGAACVMARSCHDWCFSLAPGDSVWNDGSSLWYALLHSF